jgi:hypothetical protein
VFLYLRPDFYLFDFFCGVSLLRFPLPFILLVEVLPVIHYSAYGRAVFGRYFDEIQPFPLRDGKGFSGRDNPDLVSVFVN